MTRFPSTPPPRPKKTVFLIWVKRFLLASFIIITCNCSIFTGFLKNFRCTSILTLGIVTVYTMLNIPKSLLQISLSKSFYFSSGKSNTSNFILHVVKWKRSIVFQFFQFKLSCMWLTKFLHFTRILCFFHWISGIVVAHQVCLVSVLI